MNENTIHFNYLLNDLKFKIDIENTICETNNLLTQFNSKSQTQNILL